MLKAINRLSFDHTISLILTHDQAYDLKEPILKCLFKQCLIASLELIFDRKLLLVDRSSVKDDLLVLWAPHKVIFEHEYNPILT